MPRLSREDRSAVIAIGLLLGLCLVYGLYATQGTIAPPDDDQFRDIGFAQGLLDGNWFGDPFYAGAWRWYPPLIDVVLAIGVHLTGVSPLSFWISAGPWLALLVPLSFALMTSRLQSMPAAAIATAAFVLLNGNAGLWFGDRYVPPWIAADYTPWLYVPNLALALFFLGVWLVHRRGEATRLRDAVGIGLMIGLVFLAHTVPAILLSAIVVATAIAEHGFRPRVFGWLALVAGAELAMGAVFLGPLFTHYHLHIANAMAGAWTDALLEPYSLFRKTAVMNIPGVLALAAAWFLRRQAPLGRRTMVILLTWIAVCVAFLLRHSVCATLQSDALACEVFVVPVHHFHFYLQAAWACLVGHVLWQGGRLCWRNWVGYPFRTYRAGVMSVAAVLAFAGVVGLFARPYDDEAREMAKVDGKKFDATTYRWILANTKPDDLFVTQIQSPSLEEPATYTVMAAGRRLVAARQLHSNPYVDWQARNARRQRFLAAALGLDAEQTRDLCALRAEAGADDDAWFALPVAATVSAPGLQPVFRSAFLTLYRVTTMCNSKQQLSH